MNKNTILVDDFLLGPVTINDFINYLDFLIKKNNLNQDILKSILHNTKNELDEVDIISTLHQFDFEYEFYLKN